jgi:hypothetical protein
MTIPALDQKFQRALKIFEAQVAETTQFWFAAATMNEVAKRNPDTLSALNLTPSFWITARVAMEYQAILTAAKIFGAAEDESAQHRLPLPSASRNSRRAVFEGHARSQKAPRLAECRRMDRRLHQTCACADNARREPASRAFEGHRRTYETQYADVRNLHVAHSVLVDASARWAMFQKTRIRD